MPSIASLNNVSKNFGKLTALKDLSLAINEGQAVALLGANGAGKSTALSILLGLKQATSGTAELFGKKPGDPIVMRNIGVTPQTVGFPVQLTTKELLEFAISHFPNPKKIDYLIENFGLEKIANRRVQGFSGGELRRIALALSFAGNPKLVVLDEPTSGLDAKAQKEFQIIAKDYVKNGGSLILTSHYWQEIEFIADNIIMIDKGTTVLRGAISDIKSAVNINNISFQAEKVNKFTKQNFQLIDGKWTISTNNSDKIIKQLIDSKQDFNNLTIEPQSLEEAIIIYRQKQEAN